MKLADALKACEIAKKYMGSDIALGVEFAMKIFEKVEPDGAADPPEAKTKPAKKTQAKKPGSQKKYVCENCGKEFKGFGRQKICVDCKKQKEEIRSVAAELAGETV